MSDKKSKSKKAPPKAKPAKEAPETAEPEKGRDDPLWGNPFADKPTWKPYEPAPPPPPGQSISEIAQRLRNGIDALFDPTKRPPPQTEPAPEPEPEPPLPPEISTSKTDKKLDAGFEKDIVKDMPPSQYIIKSIDAPQTKLTKEIPLTPGQAMKDGTIYLGRYTPRDRNGTSLGKVFNVFAAAKDLPKRGTYFQAVRSVAGMNGADAGPIASDDDLYAALQDGSYQGEWVMPTRDILQGKDLKGNVTMPDNIFIHQNDGAFRHTIAMLPSKASESPSWYWSLTAVGAENTLLAWAVHMIGDGAKGKNKESERLSCRPVRLVEVKGP